MSITTSYKTEIVVPKPQLHAFAGNIKGSPCMEIMRLAFEKIAKERNGRITDAYRDCAGKQHRCILGVSTSAMPNGIGLEIARDGKVSFAYDQQGANLVEAKAICDALARAYVTIAVMRIRSKHGYQVNVEKETATPKGIRVATLAVRA